MATRAANDLLRAAREETPSRREPGEGMSRGELAELVAAYVWERFGEHAGLDGKYIAKLERGVVRRPGARYREALRQVLGARTNADLGFGPITAAADSGLLDDVDRRELMRTGAMAGGVAVLAPAGAAATLLAALDEREAPRRVGPGDIEEVKTAARVVSAWSFAHGGSFATRAGRGELRWATKLLAAQCPSRLEPELYSAVSRLADACGFAAFDGNEHDRARKMFEAARRCAENAGNWPLRASALADLALLDLWLGEPAAAVSSLNRALAHAEWLVPVEQAMVWSTLARAHAQLGDVAETERALGTADAVFAQRSDDDVTPLGYYTPAEHSGSCGTALYDLALTSGVTVKGTAGRLREAIDGFGAAYARSRVHAQAQLATVLMLSDAPEEGAKVGVEALAGADGITSTRSARYVEVLAGASRRHSGQESVEELQFATARFLAA